MSKNIENCLKEAEKFNYLFSQTNPGEFSLFHKKIIKEKVIFYGGSFNPWHEGHRACLDLCPEGPIVIIPDHNPWKGLRSEGFNPWEFIVDLGNRFKDTEYSIYPGLILKNEVTPTYDWLKTVIIPQKYLIMGDDNFLTLEKWASFEPLIKILSGIYVCPRRGDKDKLLQQKERLKKLNSNLEVTFLANHQYEDLSSTNLR